MNCYVILIFLALDLLPLAPWIKWFAEAFERQFEVMGLTCRWFSSLLEFRTQGVKTVSLVPRVKYGVPQGSVASPVLCVM